MPFWLAPVLLAVLLAFTVAAATLDAVLAPGGRAAAPWHEAARLVVQQRRTTLANDPLLWRTGGGALVVVAALMLAVVPLGGWALLDSPVGIVWFNTFDVLLWAVIWIAGWGANSVWPLVGGFRFLAQALAYELPLMFALTCPAVAAGSLRIGDIQTAQAGFGYAAVMPLAFAAYLLGVLGFSLWGPFATPLGRDIAGGVLAESSGVDRLLVLLGRYALLVAGAAFAVPLFLAGGSGPVLPAAIWTLVKTAIVLAGLVALRRRLALLRPERFAELGFVVVLPLVLLQVFVTSVLVLV